MNRYLYRQEERRRYAGVLIFLFLLLWIACFVVTVEQPVPFYSVPGIFYTYVSGDALNAAEKIILFMRIPRILLGIAAGTGLAIAGAVMQSVTRNYLVSPFTLGISASAAFGASVCIAFGTTFFRTEAGIIAGAFAAACLCTAFVYYLSRYIGMSPTAMVLVGIAMNYFFSAMNATIEFFAAEYKLGEIVQWSFGTLNRANWLNASVCLFVSIVILIYFLRRALALNVMAQNDDEVAISLGIRPDALRRNITIAAVLLTATIISFTGVIGFVGLVAPHIARLVVGNDHRIFLTVSALAGGWLLVLSDAIGKFALYPVSVPVGIVISFIGVPLFVNLILAARRKA